MKDFYMIQKQISEKNAILGRSVYYIEFSVALSIIFI